MATVSPPARKPTIEFGTEPEFFVSHTRIEPAGEGLIRVFCYNERMDGFHLLYSVIMPIGYAVDAARRLIHSVADASLGQWSADHGSVPN